MIVPDWNNSQALNYYVYVHNNPLKYSDPSGHFLNLLLGAIGGAVGGAVYGYGSQVVDNLGKGMSLGDALTTNIDRGKIAFYTGVGAAIGTGIGPGVAAGVSLLTGSAATSAATAAGTTTLTAAEAACADDGCAAEANAAQKVIADTSLLYGRLIEAGEAAITPRTVIELEENGRGQLAQGFTQVCVDAQLGLAQAQAYFNRLLPAVRGKEGDVYNLATAAMRNATFLTTDKRSIFGPLIEAVKNGLVNGYIPLTPNTVVIQVPYIGQVTVVLMGGK